MPDERKSPTLCFDYLFCTKNKRMALKKELLENEEVDLKILVAKEVVSKAIFAHAVDVKGSDADGYAVARLVDDMRWLGYTRMALKTDNEAAIVKVLKDAMATARVEVQGIEQLTEEHGARYDSSSNGEAENAVKQVQRMVRTLKLCLESRLGHRIPTNHAVMTWLVEHVSWILRTRVTGADGKTAHQRITGRECGRRGIGFAEKVWYMLPRKGPEHDARAKLDALCSEGIVLGYCRGSPEYHVYSIEEKKMVTPRTIKRMPEDRRWDAKALEELDLRAKCLFDPKPARGVRVEGFAKDDTAREEQRGKSKVQRVAFYEKDYIEFGITDDCRKCLSNQKNGYNKNARGGASTMPHTERCRKRMEAALATTEDGRRRLERAQERVDAWIAKEIESADARPEGEKSDDKDVPSVAAPPQNPFEARNDIFNEFQEHVDHAKAAEGVDAEGERAREDFLDGFMEYDEQATPVAPLPGEDVNAEQAHGGEEAPHQLDGDTEMAENEHEPTEPDDEMLALMDVCVGRPDAGRKIAHDAEEILNIIRELGGSKQAYRRERKNMVNAIVSEIYSAPRVTKVLKMMPSCEVLPGFALDLTTTNARGEPWDFANADRRREARKLIEQEKPYILIGSPMCSPWSSLQRMSENRRSPEELDRMRVQAEVHLRFVCELYKAQHEAGRYFLHEHPLYATSWQNENILEVMGLEGVDTVWGDQCQYGQQGGTEDPVKKPTRWLSNSEEVLRMLDGKCVGRKGHCSRAKGGKHVLCEGKIARRAAEYPVALCKAIIQGVRNQLREDGRLRIGYIGILPQDDEDAPAQRTRRRVEKIYNVTIEDDKVEQFFDSVTGQPLVAELVKEARRKELEFFKKMAVWVKRKRGEAFSRMGKAPISVRWIDTNKGDDEQPNYRSRLVAREVRRRGEDPIFAPTPPLESLRTILSLAATEVLGGRKHDRDPHSERRTQVSFIDISRAYLTAPTDPEDPTYVELPAEDEDAGSDKCALLLKHMYGTRKAGDGWHEHYSSTLVGELGFKKGCASACVFRHPSREIECSIHGDDLTATGPKCNLDWYKAELEKVYELKESARLGPGPNDDKEAQMLHRIIRWTPEGLEYEADPRLHEQVVQDLGLKGCKGVGTPGVKPTYEQIQSDKELERKKERPYRAIAARMNYLAADRPDMQYAAKEICRWMSSPTEVGLVAMKRLGRYLAQQPRLVFKYPWQRATHIDCYSDTDWAGCPRTRKSTSGGCLMVGQHLLKSWSSTQGPISLSSGEAEFYGVVKASSTALGYQALLEDLGIPMAVRVWTDSSATIGICSRRGLGKLRHVDTQCLWIQQKVREREFELRKVKGDMNPADLCTKYLPGFGKIESLTALFGCHFRGGRAATAPKLKGGDDEVAPLLSAQREALEESIEWGDHTYPVLNIDGMRLPEAYEHKHDVLPHVHDDIDAYFPRAQACEEKPMEAVELEDEMEKRGREIGRRDAKKRKKMSPHPRHEHDPGDELDHDE